MRIMIVKSSAWTVREFETSLHPEYTAIRNLVRSFRSDFALVGIGGRRYERLCHPTLELVFYNIDVSNVALRLLSYPVLLGLVIALRPRVVVTLGMFDQIPVQLGADFVGAHHIAAAIGEPFYLTRQMRVFCKVARLHFLLKIALKRAKAIVAISEKMKRDIEKIAGVGALNIGLYHYTLSDIFRPGLRGTLKVSKDRRGSIVLTSCRIDRRKGLELVILSAPIVLRKVPKVTFIIRGPISDAKYFGELRAVIRKKGLEDVVVLTGETCAYEDLPGIISSADVFVHPSRDESLGLAIAEALACGVPVVATRVGGIPELVEHMVNGLLVEPDPVCISNAIIRIICDKDLGDRLREGARAFSDRVRQPTDSDFGYVLETKIQELLAH